MRRHGLGRPALEPRRLLLQLAARGGEEEEEAYFVDYVPPARDAITLPRDVLYILVGVVLVIVATYAIVGHLIKDLMHDLADWIFGPKPVEDDLEGGGADIEEERRPSGGAALRPAGAEQTKEEEEEEEERKGPLPGFHRASSSLRQPSGRPPPRSAMASSSFRDKRPSCHSVSFASPAAPSVTSL